jgi:hypothetical protein
MKKSYIAVAKQKDDRERNTKRMKEQYNVLRTCVSWKSQDNALNFLHREEEKYSSFSPYFSLSLSLMQHDL